MFRKTLVKTLQRQSNMSLQKPQSQYQTKNSSQSPPKRLSLPQIVVHQNKVMRLHALVKDGVYDDGKTQGQKTILWKATIPTAVNERCRYIVFKNIEYVISGWSGDGFPSVLYICVDGLQGYTKADMTSSTRGAALQLSEVNAVYDESDVRTYDLKYVLRDSATWQVPTTFVNFKVSMFIDDSLTPIILPLPNPLTLNLQVRVQ